MLVKLRKYYLIFLVLYLVALVLAGANRLIFAGTNGWKFSDTVLGKAWCFIWGLMPSQTFNWFAISGVVLVILIILGFVAGCKLIAYFMRKEKDQLRE